jgi:glycosyltransferase involved in cell wall biosynthesis
MKLLLATYNLPPEAFGGTEVYLESLTAELTRAGHAVELMSGIRGEHHGPERFHLELSSCWGLPAWRFAMDGSRLTMPELYTTRTPELRAFWTAWLSEHRPDILHLHGYSMAVSVSLMEAAASLRIPMVSTVHNVTLLCPRSDFLRWRGGICDGRAELLKCAQCAAATRAGGKLAGTAAAALAAVATPLLSVLPAPNSKGWSFLQSAFHYPTLLRMHLACQKEMLGIAGRWHVFSEWSRQTLILNGASRDRIALIRHPMPRSAERAAPIPRAKREGVLRLGFFGRFNKVKGLAILLDAIRRLPDAPLQLELYGRAQDSQEESIEEQVRAAAAADSRIIWHGQIPSSAQPEALSRLDVVVAPSIWVETGPLTVLEAFAAGVPVLGSDLSGINERVTEGENGWLFPSGDSAALAQKIAMLCADPTMLNKAQCFPHLDSAAEHAAQVMQLYEAVLSTPPSGALHAA